MRMDIYDGGTLHTNQMSSPPFGRSDAVEKKVRNMAKRDGAVKSRFSIVISTPVSRDDSRHSPLSKIPTACQPADNV